MVAVSHRYLSMICRYIPSLSDREWGVIFDVLRRPWTAEPHLVARIPRAAATALETDRLDIKWGVDGRRLLTRLNRTSYAERLAIAEMTMAFYHRLEAGEPATIETLKSLFRSQAPERPAPSIPRLSPALLLGEEAAEETAAAYRAAMSASFVTEAPPRPDTETAPGGGDEDALHTETNPDGAPGGPEPAVAPPLGPEATSPAMALGVDPGAHVPLSEAGETDAGREATDAATGPEAETTDDASDGSSAPGDEAARGAVTIAEGDTAPTTADDETGSSAPTTPMTPEGQSGLTASEEETAPTGPTTADDASGQTTQTAATTSDDESGQTTHTAP